MNQCAGERFDADRGKSSMRGRGRRVDSLEPILNVENKDTKI